MIWPFLSAGVNYEVYARMVQAIPTQAFSADVGATFDITQEVLKSSSYIRAGSDLVLQMDDGHEIVVDGYFQSNPPPALMADNGAYLTGETVSSLAGPGLVQVAQAGGTTPAAATAEDIGQVKTLVGNATAQHTDGSQVDLQIGSPVYKGDVVQVSQDGKLGITFEDGAVFSLSDGGTMALDDMVYNPGGSSNKMLFTLVKGALGLITGEIAGSGGVEVNTPSAVLAIRGTTAITFGEPDGSWVALCADCPHGPFLAFTDPNTPPVQIDADGTALVFALGGDQPPVVVPMTGDLADKAKDILQLLKNIQVAELQNLLKTGSAFFETLSTLAELVSIEGTPTSQINDLLAALLNNLELEVNSLQLADIETPDQPLPPTPEIAEIDAGTANEDDPDDVVIDLVSGQSDFFQLVKSPVWN